jgi:hypothetical protein
VSTILRGRRISYTQGRSTNLKETKAKGKEKENIAHPSPGKESEWGLHGDRLDMFDLTAVNQMGKAL